MLSKRALTSKANKLAKKQNRQPGKEYKMTPKPRYHPHQYNYGKHLENKVAVITGGDSGIGRAVALLFAQEGADVIIIYLDEHRDAQKTQQEVVKLGRSCEIISQNISEEKNCRQTIKAIISKFKKIDILVNNAGVQFPQKSITDISQEQLYKTFETNIFSYFYMIKYTLPFMKKGGIIINTTSVTAYKGSESLLDYSATKGAIVSLTRSLAINLVKKGIRVNGVAPGPIWTPLIPSSFDKKKLKKFGKNVPMQRMGQPEEIAPAYLFLASSLSSYMTGQILHPNGGVVLNG